MIGTQTGFFERNRMWRMDRKAEVNDCYGLWGFPERDKKERTLYSVKYVDILIMPESRKALENMLRVRLR